MMGLLVGCKSDVEDATTSEPTIIEYETPYQKCSLCEEIKFAELMMWTVHPILYAMIATMNLQPLSKSPEPVVYVVKKNLVPVT